MIELKLVKCKNCGGDQIPPDEDESYACLNCGEILIVKCDFIKTCPKSSDFCFNQYKDVCSTRRVLLLSKTLNQSKIKRWK